jgi:branched-chain amino acid transport system ATP-binding protein
MTQANGGAPMLALREVVAGYGGILALRGISVEVYPKEIVTLIGSNGAGKSTTLRSITGQVHLRSGAIEFEGRRLDQMAPHKIVNLGVSHVPEGRGIFFRLSVRENLELGAYAQKKVEKDELDRVFSLFPRLKERVNQPGGTLSGGEQQMLAIGRALMSKPRLLLLDEPSMGLSPILTELIFATIQDINTRLGTTILLVEQNAHMALEIASRGYVLESGTIALEAPAAELAVNEDVRRAYLGEL